MSATLEITIMGCGSSSGVPRPDGDWGACDPAEPKNLRSRCSLLVRRVDANPPLQWTTAIVDTSPDLRLQCLAAGVKRVDAVLLSHDHADQVHGIDDIRTYFNIQRARIPCWMDAATEASMKRRFDYIFENQGGYYAIASARSLPLHGEAWSLDGPSGVIPVVSFDQDHGGVRSAGFRFGDVAYSSDVVDLDEAAFAALEGVDTWIVDALRWTPHPTHAHVDKALKWIERVKPRRAILTNMHIDIDYADIKGKLPAGVEPAFDGLRFEHELGSRFS